MPEPGGLETRPCRLNSEAGLRRRQLPRSPFQRSRFAADAIACSKEALSEIRDVHTNGSPTCVLVSGYDEAIGAWASWLDRWNLAIEVDPQAFFLSTTSRPKSIENP